MTALYNDDAAGTLWIVSLQFGQQRSRQLHASMPRTESTDEWFDDNSRVAQRLGRLFERSRPLMRRVYERCVDQQNVSLLLRLKRETFWQRRVVDERSSVRQLWLLGRQHAAVCWGSCSARYDTTPSVANSALCTAQRLLPFYHATAAVVHVDPLSAAHNIPVPVRCSLTVRPTDQSQAADVVATDHQLDLV